MWRSWAFFFFAAPTPLTRTGSGSLAQRLTASPAHWLTGSPAQDKLQPNQARDLYLERLWSVTSKMCSVREGSGLLLPKGILFRRAFFLICQTAFPNGKPFVCNIPKPFQRENTLSPAHRLKPSRSQAEPGICFWKGFGMLLTKGFLFGNAFFIFRCPGP